MTELRGGYTTGACAAAAAKAAAMVLCGAEPPVCVTLELPDGEAVEFGIINARRIEGGAEAAVRKDAGDDPDITHGAFVVASVRWADDGALRVLAGEGVGTVTKPGLQAPPGEPAINPAPRRMIKAAVRTVTPRGVQVTISIPGGRELAAKTFNQRLGIEGGLSVLGTTGRVRPFSCPVLREALRCALDVAAAAGVTAPVLVPGHIGERAAQRHFRLRDEQVVLVGNEWGFMLDSVRERPFERLLVVGHPGKLAKLAAGEWDTHSSRSSSAVPLVMTLAARVTGRPAPESPTVEGVFAALAQPARAQLGDELAREVQRALEARVRHGQAVTVGLVNMEGDILGGAGDFGAWQ